MSNVNIKRITRMRMGWCLDKSTKYKFRLSDSELCETCNVKDNYIHRLTECTTYIQERNEFCKDLNIDKLVLILKDKKFYRDFLKFTEKINLET